MEDVLIIGAGITGSFLARDLSRYQLNITVVDREADIANETTMANSAIIHTGYDPKDGTLKARLNVNGARMYERICKELHVSYQKCGAYVVATDEMEIAVLNELKERADRRGITADIVTREELLKEEKNLSDHVIKGLSVPDTAVIYPWECAIALMEDAVMNGVTLKLNCTVTDIKEEKDRFIVYTSKGTYESRVVINAAGYGADVIARMVETPPFSIEAKKGEYYVLSRHASDFVKHVIYPVPSKKGKGVLAVPTVHGNILLGPTNEVCEQGDTSVTQHGLDHIRSQIERIVKHVPYTEVIRSYAGIRAAGNQGDFYIRPMMSNPRLIHVACIDSPGLASSPAISEYVIETYVKKVISLKKKKEVVHRPAPLVMKELSLQEKNAAISREPLYGKIVCRCENISYQEIVDAIHTTCGAVTIKGIKKRVRPGMGKCQGGFCEVEVAKIIADELHIPLTDVLYDGEDTKLGMEVK